MGQKRYQTDKSLRDEKAATLVEYAILAALIAFAILASAAMVGERTNDTFWEAGYQLGGQAAGWTWNGGGSSSSGGGNW